MATRKKNLIENDYTKIVFYLLLPLLLLPPFFRGLFFPYEADFAHSYTALVLGVYIWMRKDYIKLSRNLMDYAWIGLIAAYIISSFMAVNVRDAVESALAVFNFFVIYWLLAQNVNTEDEFKVALGTMYLAGFGVALAGLGTAFGTFSFNGAFDSGLILSTLQYHNATAIFLVASGIVGFYLASALDNLWMRIACGGLNYIIIATAFGAGSRGAMLVAPVGFILLLIGLPKEYRFKVFLNMLGVLIPFFITAKQVLNFGTNSEGYHWLWLFIGVVIGCACQAIIEKFLSLSDVTKKRVITGTGIAVVLAGVGMVLFMGSKIMPTSIAARLSYVSLQDVNVVHRFYYYQDALKIIKDYPLFGVGGGGWEPTYPRYQDFLYYTTEVHSHPLRVWVETGTVGFAFYVLIWLGLIISMVRIIKRVKDPEYRAIAWTAAVAALSICLHSMIDFSLSLGAVAIMMWGLVGLVRAVDRKSTEEEFAKAKTISTTTVRRAVGTVLVSIFFLLSGSLYIGGVKDKDAGLAYQAGDIQGALSAFESAASFDPFNYKYQMYMAQIYNNLAFQRKDMNMAKTAIDKAQKAVELNRASQPMMVLSQMYMTAGMPQEGVNEAKEALAYAPWRQDSYDVLAKVYLAAAQQFLRMGQRDNAKTVLNELVVMPEQIEAKLKTGVSQKDLWFRGVLTVDDTIKQTVEEGKQFLKSM